MSKVKEKSPAELDAELNIANLIMYYQLGGEFPDAFCVICNTYHNQRVWYCMA